jgi:hypothetical protein
VIAAAWEAWDEDREAAGMGKGFGGHVEAPVWPQAHALLNDLTGN